MGIDDIIALPNQDHGIKECVLTFFLKSPIEDLDSFPDFFKSSLGSMFKKYDALNTFSFTFPVPNNKDQEIENESNKLGGFRLFKLTDNNSTEIICQVLNERNRQFFAIHCMYYKTWNFFKSATKQIIKEFEGWLDNEIVALNLYYIDEFKSKEEVISLDRIFRKESDLLPSGFFKSQNTFLVFNTQRLNEASSVEYFDKIELKNQNKVMSIGHSTVIPTKSVKFNQLLGSNEIWESIEWAHENNKTFLKDVLSVEVQKYIGLIT